MVPGEQVAMTIAKSRAEHADVVPDAMDVPVHAPAFVGREGELAAITSALEHTPSFVLIEGEAGIGKSRLLREVLALEVMRDRRVLVAACPPVREPFPLGPIVDALRGANRTVAGVKLSPLAGALRPLFPEWAADLPPAPEPMPDARAVRHRLLSALVELVERLGVETLVVEDAHWADAATLELLLMLPARMSSGISVVLTYRPEDVPSDSLLRQLTSRRMSGVTELRVELTSLTAEETRALVASMLAADQISAEFVTFLHGATGGLPLALEECVRLMRDRRDIVHQDGRWARIPMDELRVPATVRDSVLERVARLSPDAQRVLEAAAVLGAPSDESTFAAVAGLGERETRLGLGDGIASRLLAESSPGQLVFRHALAAKAVYEAIPSSERRHMHLLTGRALEQLHQPPVSRLVRHFRIALDTESWSRYSEAAAQLALESGDDHTAVSILLAPLTDATHPADRYASLARKLGMAMASGRSLLAEADRVVDALRSAVARDDLPSEAHGEIRYALGRFLLQRGLLEEGCAELDRSIANLGHHPAFAARALLLLARVPLAGHSVARRLQWISRADALIPLVASAAEQFPLIVDHALALLELGDERGWRLVDELPEDPETWAVRQDVARGHGNLGLHALEWGRYDQAKKSLDAALGLIESDAYTRELPFNAINQADLRYRTGQWPGLTTTVAALANSQEYSLVVRSEATVLHGLLTLASGDTQAAETTLRAVLDDTDPASESIAATAAVARLHLVRGEASDAVAISAASVEVIRSTGLWLGAIEIAPVHVEALVAAGAIDRAEELVHEFAGWLDGRHVPAAEAALASCWASVAAGSGEVRAGAELFARAADLWAALPCPYHELLARERVGRCLLDVDDTDSAVAVLTDAQRRLTELGARWDADRVAQLLRHHGIEVARPWRGGRRGYGDRLSPRELEVTRLVAEGMTNREVGEVLFLSPRTVDRHLSGAMRKLGVHSRTMLAKVVATGGLPSGDSGVPAG